MGRNRVGEHQEATQNCTRGHCLPGHLPLNSDLHLSLGFLTEATSNSNVTSFSYLPEKIEGSWNCSSGNPRAQPLSEL